MARTKQTMRHQRLDTPKSQPAMATGPPGPPPDMPKDCDAKMEAELRRTWFSWQLWHGRRVTSNRKLIKKVRESEECVRKREASVEVWKKKLLQREKGQIEMGRALAAGWREVDAFRGSFLHEREIKEKAVSDAKELRLENERLKRIVESQGRELEGTSSFYPVVVHSDDSGDTSSGESP